MAFKCSIYFGADLFFDSLEALSLHASVVFDRGADNAPHIGDEIGDY
jgi:hypothetical protein